MTRESDTDTAMEVEFDTVATWTKEAVRQLGPEYAVPAACRGSASPSALDWLAWACALDAGVRLLDAGAGLGGPAAYAAQHFGASPVLVEPMVGACRGAVELFGLPTVVGAGEWLPLATDSMDAAWCLGVLSTTTAKAELLRELHRVLRAGAPLGLLVFVAVTPDVPAAPQGNVFPSESELGSLLDGAGFTVAEQLDAADRRAPPHSWQDRVDRVERALDDAHGTDPRLAEAREQEKRIARLLADGYVKGRLLHAIPH